MLVTKNINYQMQTVKKASYLTHFSYSYKFIHFSFDILFAVHFSFIDSLI